MSPPSIWNIPNLLSLSRLPLAAGLFVCITYELWPAGLSIFGIAALTDWLDGWWARRYGPTTAVGRSLDPLTDKVLVCGAFIYLMVAPGVGIAPWMVTVVVAREVVVTGLRGIVEATGATFGADWFGKLKTGLQCATIAGALFVQWLRELDNLTGLLPAAELIQAGLLYSALAATIGSGVQYLVKAARVLR
jgi:CDP-diacylglycerol--glycerol-3-phosphate 3-phosphatidyltransferase